MRRLAALILAFFIAAVFAGCQRQEKAKKYIFNLVEENYDAIIKACQEKDADALDHIYGITEVAVFEDYVIAFCKGEGNAASSQDYGFYYSAENLPVVIDCDEEILCDTDELMPEGLGYRYVFDGNVFYTEYIMDNIYFYSTAY